MPNDSTIGIDHDDKLDLLTAILASGMLNPGSDAEEAAETFKLVRERLETMLGRRSEPESSPEA
ncbi:hypothetical protein [Benzoatithermus flavus]|uniref:Uncharacterized protein n=1 Tax=Benzoatithermus flavus TaxID=3108223 RepID=A0ABU8XXQ3_9PROT